MPTYDYICTACNYKFEHFQSMSDEPISVCQNCGKTVRRLISGGTGLIFKGNGYYITDYKRKSNSKEVIKKPLESKNTKKTKDKND
jgi:putative FmdB family regulatory protein